MANCLIKMTFDITSIVCNIWMWYTIHPFRKYRNFFSFFSFFLLKKNSTQNLNKRKKRKIKLQSNVKRWFEHNTIFLSFCTILGELNLKNMQNNCFHPKTKIKTKPNQFACVCVCCLGSLCLAIRFRKSNVFQKQSQPEIKRLGHSDDLWFIRTHFLLFIFTTAF